MEDLTGKAIIDRLNHMMSDRTSLDSVFDEIASYVHPQRWDFLVTREESDRKRTAHIYNGIGFRVVENLASGIWGTMTNSANKWFSLGPLNQRLSRDYQVQQWFENATSILMSEFSQGGQRFYTILMDLFKDLVSFGTAVLMIEEDEKNKEVYYRCLHLKECFIDENYRGDVDTLFRKFQLTARQALQLYGEKLSKEIIECANKDPQKKFEFVHAVMPQDDHQPGLMLDVRGKPFSSICVEYNSRNVVSREGYWEFPYVVARWSRASKGLYGDSPAMLALPDIKMINAMGKTTIIGAEKAVDPTLLAPDKDSIGRGGIRTTPGGIIYGGMGENGQRLYDVLNTGSNAGLGIELQNMVSENIKEAFYWSLLNTLQQPGMTLGEFMGRRDENIRMMGPVLGRNASEVLHPIIIRSFNIAFRQGKFPPLPDILKEDPNFKIEYISPFAQAQKAGEGASIMRLMESISPFVGLDRNIIDAINVDKAVRILREAYGAPVEILRDEDEIEQIRAAKQEEMQAQMLAQGAQPVGAGIKDMAKGLETINNMGV